MAHIKWSAVRRTRKEKNLYLNKACHRANKPFCVADEGIKKAVRYNYRNPRIKKNRKPRTKKLNFRGPWLRRINTDIRQSVLSRTRFMKGLEKDFLISELESLQSILLGMGALSDIYSDPIGGRRYGQSAVAKTSHRVVDAAGGVWKQRDPRTGTFDESRPNVKNVRK